MTAPLPGAAYPPRSRRRWRLLAAVILLLLLIAPGAWLAQRGASRLEFFHVRSIVVEGTRYLSPEAVIERLAVDTMRSVWDDTAPLAERLSSMPQVAGVSITRRLPGTLVVTISENLPVALAPSPRGLEALDSLGRVLPIDPTAADLDLPVAAQRDRQILSLLGDTRATNPAMFDRISEVRRDGGGGLIVLLMPLGGRAAAVTPADPLDADADTAAAAPPALLRVRANMGVSARRLADIFPVESDLVRRRANVAELDLRYRDQVIARLQ